MFSLGHLTSFVRGKIFGGKVIKLKLIFSDLFIETYTNIWASQVAVVVKNPPGNAGDIGDTGRIPGMGRSPGELNENSLQYSCL